ncbi:MAG: hypothetical protein IK090_03025, partial [Clostridia bacterium]|nr:hypothetical protein [Clostridia bacterium]
APVEEDAEEDEAEPEETEEETEDEPEEAEDAGIDEDAERRRLEALEAARIAREQDEEERLFGFGPRRDD